MKVSDTVNDPVVRELIANIEQRPVSLNIQDIVNEIKHILAQEADVYAAMTLAKRIKLKVPKAWQEDCLKKSIATGRFVNTVITLELLERELSQKEISKLIEQIILVGDLSALHEIEELSNESFGLAIWQNTVINRTVRLIWEKRNNKLSPLSNILTFHTDYKDILLDFDIRVLGKFHYHTTGKTFQCFSQHTMSLFLLHLVRLDSDSLSKKIAREIKNVSAVG